MVWNFPWNFRSLELSLLELSLPFRERKFQELWLPGTFAPWNICFQERKFQKLSLSGTFVPWNFSSRERKFQELSLSLPVTFARDIRS